MIFIIALSAFILGTGLMLVKPVFQIRQQKKVLKKIARHLGFTYTSKKLSYHISGVHKGTGLAVALTRPFSKIGHGYRFLKISAKIPSLYLSGSYKMMIKTDYLLSEFSDPLDDSCIQKTGDIFFDQHIIVKGENNQIPRAYLNNHVRNMVFDLRNIIPDLLITQSEIKGTLEITHKTLEQDILQAVSLIEKIIDNLTGPLPLNKKLESIILNDPLKNVRLRSFHSLIDFYPNKSEKSKTIDLFLNHPEPLFRLEAFYQLHLLGKDQTEKIIDFFHDPSIDCQLRVLKIGQKLGTKDLIPPMKRLFNRSNYEVVKMGVLRAFQNMKDIQGENGEINRFLLERVKNKTSHIIRRELLNTLSKTGTVNELYPLQVLAKNTKDLEFKLLISRLVSDMRSRLKKTGDTGKGRVSLVEAEQIPGKLSVSREE